MNQAIHAGFAQGNVRFANGSDAGSFPLLTHELGELQREVLHRRRAEEAAHAASRAKDYFLSVLSHELRTPLSPVLVITSALEQLDLPPQVREDIATIRRCVDLETRLIDDLLDVTRISRGKLELRPQVIDAHAKLRNALLICQTEFDVKRLCIVRSLEARRHHLWADPARLQQVFWNLLRNAIKFTPDGGTITLRSWNDESGRLHMQVADSGIGIEPDLLGRIFQPFEQGDRSTTRVFGGLGLGLAISKSIVELHGGQLTADSPGKGHGATFTLSLDPLVDGASLASPAEPALKQRFDDHPLRILLVEDHRDTSRVMVRLLRKAGHSVTAADTVAKALELAGAESFDLLISDIGLPDGTGLDVMRQLRALRPIPGIVLSGFGTETDLQKSHAAGFSHHLVKPVDLPRLQAAIHQIARSATARPLPV